MFPEQEWEIELEHVKRAYRLMSILNSIRESFRVDRVRQAEAEAGIAPSISAKDSDDRDLPGCQSISGTWTTEIVRRMLFKSAPTDTPGEYKCHSTKTWQLFPGKGKTKIGKLIVYAFKEFAKLCPPEIGRFDGDQDSLMWKMPDEPDAECQRVLTEYANVAA